jgi:hypothetical protein
MRGLSRGTPTLALKFHCIRIITPPGWIVVGRGGRGRPHSGQDAATGYRVRQRSGDGSLFA